MWLVPALVAKILCGIIYGYLYAHYFPDSDSWNYFRESLIDYRILLHNPVRFFSYRLNTSTITELFSVADNAFWSNVGENLLIKLLAVLNVFTGGNYYLTSILFNCFTFWGLYLLYALARKYFSGKSGLLILLIFFLPSCLFWNSGMDKDGLLVFFAGIFMFCLNKCLTEKVGFKCVLLCLAGFAGLLFMRSFTAITFVPAAIAWLLSFKAKRNAYLYFAGIYVLCIALFFWSGTSGTAYNLPLRFAEKQHGFIALEGNTKLPLTPLEPTVSSYIKVLPQALNHVFLRPYITEIKSPFHLVSFGENMVVVAFIIMVIWSAKKRVVLIFHHPFSLFLISVALTNMLGIGYTVPFTGAIMRYKALYVVLLLIPFLNCIRTYSDRTVETYI